MEFKISEKLAMVNVIDALIIADGQIHKGEISALSSLMKVIDFDSNFLIQARTLDTDQSVNILKEMPMDKKHALVQILEKVAESDGFVHQKENALINHVTTTMGL